MTELHPDYRFTAAAEEAGSLAELTPDAYKYEILRSTVMAEARAVRASMAARDACSLLIPYSPTLDAAIATFDENFSGTPNGYKSDQLFGYGIEIRLGDHRAKYFPGVGMREDRQTLAERPISIYYAYLDADRQPLTSQFRFGIKPEIGDIETANSFYLWGNPYFKMTPDTEDLAYMNALLLDAQQKTEEVTPMRSAALWAAVEELLRLQLPE